MATLVPVILTTLDETDQWMTAPIEEALILHTSLPDDTLRIVTRGEKQDGAESVTPELIFVGSEVPNATLQTY